MPELASKRLWNVKYSWGSVLLKPWSVSWFYISSPPLTKILGAPLSMSLFYPLPNPGQVGVNGSMTPLTPRFDFIPVGKMRAWQYTHPTPNGHGKPMKRGNKWWKIMCWLFSQGCLCTDIMEWIHIILAENNIYIYIFFFFFFFFQSTPKCTEVCFRTNIVWNWWREVLNFRYVSCDACAS